MRRRVAGAGVTALVLVAMVAALGAPAASAACPNEAFRTGPSASLDECRAYEMVTPVDKESGEGVFATQGSTGAKASPSGDGVYFHSLSAYAGPQSNTFANPYVSSRLGEDWSTQAVGGRQTNAGSILLTTVYGVSEDLGLALVGSLEALAPGAVPGDSNLYVRDNRTGAYILVETVPGESFYEGWSDTASPSLPLVAATADWSNMLVRGPEGLYEFTGGQLRLAAAEGRRVAENESAPNQMSADGTRFFYYGEGNVIYEHRLGAEALRVSEDEEGNPLTGRFVGAAPSGEVAFFEANGALFRFRASAPPGSRTKQITPALDIDGSETTQVLSSVASEDASTVYFIANDRLTADAKPREGGSEYLYAWHEEAGGQGRISFVVQREAAGIGTASPTGRFLAFNSSLRLTPDAIDTTGPGCVRQYEGRCRNLFRYSLDTGQIVCVSCDGTSPVGSSTLGGSEEQTYSSIRSRVMLDDGTVLFETPNALVPRDINGAVDVYAYRDGAARLISSGRSPDKSLFVEATPTGSDVYFQTKEALVGQDVDAGSDLYDARVLGGLPQEGEATTAPCATEGACRGGTAAGAPPASPASGAVEGSNVAGACLVVQGKARAAAGRSRALARRAKGADGTRAKALRKSAARQAKVAGRLARRAHNCTGGRR